MKKARRRVRLWHTHSEMGVQKSAPEAIPSCLLKPRHGLRPGAADAVYIVIRINVLGARGQSQRDEILHVVQPAAAWDRVLREPVLRPRSDALMWPAIRQVARLRGRIPITDVRPEPITREGLLIALDEVALWIEEARPAISDHHAWQCRIPR